MSDPTTTTPAAVDWSAVRRDFPILNQPVLDGKRPLAFLDSAALGLLMVTNRQLLADKRTLSLAYPGPTVRQIIELANLQKTIPLIESDASPRIRKTA